MRRLYTLLLGAALPLVLARLWWRGRREAGYREALRERFGLYDEPFDGPLVWIHAVSVGEVRASAPLVQRLREALPDHRILVTCMTAAGRATIKQVYGESVLSAYLPYDFPGATQRFLEHFRPRMGVIMETELWPNLLAACAANGTPMLLANARMSEKSARGYERWSALTGPGLRSLAAVLAQSEADADRLRALGATNVEVAGNLKFDVPFDQPHFYAGRQWRERVGRPVLLLASTREGEERMLLDALPPWDGKLLVVVVPRHPQRFDEVATLADSRRSAAALPGPEDRIHLGDTMGEMFFYYAACDVALVGGSFKPLGGQNVIEAFACGAPAVTGPHVFNFTEVVRLGRDVGALVQAADAPAAMREALALLADEKRRTHMSTAGRALCETNRGAADRHLEACLRVLGS